MASTQTGSPCWPGLTEPGAHHRRQLRGRASSSGRAGLRPTPTGCANPVQLAAAVPAGQPCLDLFCGSGRWRSRRCRAARRSATLSIFPESAARSPAKTWSGWARGRRAGGGRRRGVDRAVRDRSLRHRLRRSAVRRRTAQRCSAAGALGAAGAGGACLPRMRRRRGGARAAAGWLLYREKSAGQVAYACTWRRTDRRAAMRGELSRAAFVARRVFGYHAAPRP